MFWKKKRKIKNPKEEINKTKGGKNIISAVIDYLADGLLVFDEKSKLVLINPQAEKFLDMESKKALGEQILKLSRFSKAKPLVSILGGEIKEVSKEELKIKKNFILEVSAVSMISNGRKIGSLVILHDISQEKLIEKTKSEFVAIAAHQLRTPASVIKWTTQMLLEEDLGGINKEQRKSIGRIFETNERTIQLISNLLNVAEIEEGKYLSKVALLSIEDIINPLIDTYKKEAEKKKVKFEFQKPKQVLPKIMMDKEKMKIAIRVFIDNAVRYTVVGGKVSVSLLIKEREIEIQIQDTGLGIPGGQQDKIFNKFFRAENIARIDIRGAGLGLYIAKNIIEAHEGKVWFESEEGKGSIFYLTLPIKKKFAEFVDKKFY